jgi:SAM-dependent methyltransferase
MLQTLSRSWLTWSTALTLALLPCLPAAAQTVGDVEVPFITSPDNVTLEMLRMADVRAGDHVIDLGSGDGRIVILAAKRFGATGLGVEIDPDLVARSLRSAKDAGVADRVQFRVEDLFTTDLSKATVITMYLLPEFNLRLRPSVLALKPGTRIVSHDWDMGDWQPDQTTVLPVPDKVVGREKSSKVHLWVVPAQVQGLWCGTGPLRGSALDFSQRYQAVSGTLNHRQRSRAVEGRLQGASVSVAAGRNAELGLQVQGDEMRVTAAQGDLALARGHAFRRAAAGSSGCT